MLADASGGRMECWSTATGPTDFVIIGSIDNLSARMAGVMACVTVGPSSRTFGHTETQQLIRCEAFTTIQEHAGDLRSSHISAA